MKIRKLGAHYIALYVNSGNLTLFESFRVQHIPEEIKRLIGNENIATNIFRMEANSVMHGYLCNGFVFMLTGKSFIDQTIFFLPKSI